MALLANWVRIEPHALTTDIDPGLSAEIADPCWMLLRQLQLGELHGDDCGSPAAVDVSVSWSPITRYRPGADPGPGDRVDAAAAPLEAVVEREPVIRLGGYTPWSVRVRAGRRLHRALEAAGLSDVAQRLAAHDRTRFTAVGTTGDAEVNGPTDERYRVLLAGNGRAVIDGSRVLELLAEGALPADLLGDSDAEQVAAAVAGWRAEVNAEWGVAPAGHTLAAAWQPERQEYAFAVGAPPMPGDDGEIILQATEYDGTGLRWDALDLEVDQACALGATGDGGARRTVRSVLPSALSYDGMPAARFWEFEDAAVALGRVRSGLTDLTRMLAVDFAVVYSPDWHLVPVEVPVGGIARIDWVVVRDTFGVATLVGTTATQRRDGAGRLFQPSTRGDGADTGDNPYLVVLPAALGVLNSEPLEEVTLQRDEMANLAWCIERTVLGNSGAPVPRPWFAAEFDLPIARSEPGSFELTWRLATRVPETWTPLVAVAEPARMLRKARILDTEHTRLNAANGLLAADVGDIRDEEITRAGVQLRLNEQRARMPDGRTAVWRGREKRPWRGEASSGLRFDDATPDG